MPVLIAGTQPIDLRALGAALLARLTEAPGDSHFYGSWKGGSAKSGGGPAGPEGIPHTDGQSDIDDPSIVPAKLSSAGTAALDMAKVGDRVELISIPPKWPGYPERKPQAIRGLVLARSTVAGQPRVRVGTNGKQTGEVDVTHASIRAFAVTGAAQPGSRIEYEAYQKAPHPAAVRAAQARAANAIPVGEALVAALAEKAQSDHFYGAWKGGKASEGGGPAGGAYGEDPLGERSETATAMVQNTRDLALWKDVENWPATRPWELSAADIEAGKGGDSFRAVHYGRNDPVLASVTGTVGTGKININVDRWDEYTPSQRAGIMYHEVGHLASGSLADTPGGADKVLALAYKNPSDHVFPASAWGEGLKHGVDPKGEEVANLFAARWTSGARLEQDPTGTITLPSMPKARFVLDERDAALRKFIDAESRYVGAITGEQALLYGPNAIYKQPKSTKPKRTREALSESLIDVLEKGTDHFYGAWKGGKAAAGGGPPPDTTKRDEAAVALRRVQRAKGDGGGAHASAAGWNERVNKQMTLAGVRHTGKPGTGVIFPEKGPYPGERVVFFGDNGKPAATVRVSNKGKYIDLVEVSPGQRGKGVGSAMYDWMQDNSHIDLYNAVGRSRDFTVAGKAFAQNWLEHRVSLEAARAGIKEAESSSAADAYERAKAALDHVKKAPISPNGMRSPEERGEDEKPLAEALIDVLEKAGTDHFYGAWKGGRASSGGGPADSPEGRAEIAKTR